MTAELHSPFDPDSGPFYALLVVSLCAAVGLMLHFGFHMHREVLLVALPWLCMVPGGMGLRRLGYQRAAGALEIIPALYGQGFVGGILIVGVTAFHAPYADGWLSAADHALGLSWPDFVNHFRGHERFWVWCYDSFAWQPFLVGALLCWRGETARAWAFATAATLSLLVSTLVFAGFPALAPYHFYHAPSFGPYVNATYFIEPMEYIRHGGRNFTRFLLAGGITFPSYHAATAILFCWAAWKTPLRWPVIALNTLVMLAAIVVGGHYFIDLLGGIAVAAMAIYTSKAFIRRSGRKQSECSGVPSRASALSAAVGAGGPA